MTKRYKLQNICVALNTESVLGRNAVFCNAIINGAW